MPNFQILFIVNITDDLNAKGYIANIQGNNVEKKIICSTKMQR